MGKLTSLMPWVILGACSVGLVGCANSKAGQASSPRALRPADFVAAHGTNDPMVPRSHLVEVLDARAAQPRKQSAGKQPSEKPMQGGPTTATTSAASPAQPAASTATAPKPAAPHPLPTYDMDGMVGQVNGQPLYAGQIFQPLDDQLAALGRQLPSAAFHDRARELITSRLGQMVTDNLLLGEAERDLSENERYRLTQMVAFKRQELIRLHGRGAPSVAEAELIKSTGQTLAQTLEDYRQRVLVQRYLHRKLMPKINVTRRDIERYYRDHADEFHSPMRRTIRLIRTAKQEDAKKVSDALKAGQSFAHVASGDLNQYNAGGGGRMEAPGDNPLAFDKLNQAMAQLEAGQWIGPIAAGGGFWFVDIVKIQQAKSQSLRDAQLDIGDRLREQQYRVLSHRYRQKMYQQGSYEAIPSMTRTLVAIAMSRYARS